MSDAGLHCATWNIHRAKGTDGQRDPARIVACIRETFAPLGLDLLSLQEADEECPPHGRIVDVAAIGAATGLVYQHDLKDLRWGPQSDGFLGTIVFVHPRHTILHRDVIDLPGHCHRGVVVLDIETNGRQLRVVTGHLSLGQVLRAVQMRVIGQYLFRRPAMPTLLLGDLNEWRPWGGVMFHKALVRRRFVGPVRRTFPSTRPLLPLDRIMVDDPAIAVSAEVLNTPDIAVASDHLPLKGHLTFA